MKRLLLLILLSFAGTWVSAAEDCFDRIARDKGLDADLLRAIAFVNLPAIRLLSVVMLPAKTTDSCRLIPAGSSVLRPLSQSC